MLKRLLFIVSFCAIGSSAMSQTLDDSGISAGFFDSSFSKDINFSDFHLPPLGVLFENAKSNPNILQFAKQQEILQADVTKQKKHIFSYVNGHGSYSYGKTDMWGNNSSTYSTMIYQFQGSEQNYWNIGVSVNVPLEDLLDITQSVRRKRLLVEEAKLKKDAAFDDLKLQIVTLYIRITNNLSALKTAGISAAIYQGANQLEEEDFHQGNMQIGDYAYSSLRGQNAVNTYQGLLTQITTDIVTLEILSHTPILTNTTTEITLDSTVRKSEKQIRKENKAIEKRIKEETEKEEKKIAAMEKAEREKKEKAEKSKKEIK
ncbi:TolC family protein [Prevotella sp. E13-27]|uniref:TolC family protein n=1 Tax=Prevotella sp. E13-27 TaxID=2938122 RepID=UPI00200B4490|nr:TolC family protein [Prevotella sp. E13-27]MCK8622971.1 TolC family protein [Prevotella sp. E13-27]